MSEKNIMVTVVREEASALSVVDSVLAKVKAEGKRDITFAGNCSSIDQVKNFLSSAKPTPTIVWSEEEQQEVMKIARETIPSIRTFAIPTTLYKEQGKEGVTNYVMDNMGNFYD